MLNSNRQNAEAIKEMKNNVKISNEMYKEKIKQNAKKRYFENINEELEKKTEAQQKIKDLENKESELIKLLQKTNELEVMAMEDLQKIINGENPEFFDDLNITAEDRDNE